VTALTWRMTDAASGGRTNWLCGLKTLARRILNRVVHLGLNRVVHLGSVGWLGRVGLVDPIQFDRLGYAQQTPMVGINSI
jgi:hypothetical protein